MQSNFRVSCKFLHSFRAVVVLELLSAGGKANLDDPMEAGNLSAVQIAADSDKTATNSAAENPNPFQCSVSGCSTTYKNRGRLRFHEIVITFVLKAEYS